MTLEDSINLYHIKFHDRLVARLLQDPKVPTPETRGVYYLKRYLQDGLAEHLERDGIRFDSTKKDFADTLGEINWIALKQAGYGTLQGRLSKDISQFLQPWEAVYLYSGIWAVKSSKYQKRYFIPKAEKQTLYQNLRELIEIGMERIKFIHNKEHEKGKYKYAIEKVPHQDEVMERWEKPKITSKSKLMRNKPNQYRMDLSE